MAYDKLNGSVRVPIQQLFNLHGKIAIVTGATGGIGSPVTVALAEAGASIVSIQVPKDINADALRIAVEATGQTFRHFECNLMDASSIKTCFTEIWDAGIVPDILFHAAGITHKSTVVETSVGTLDRVGSHIIRSSA